MKRLIDQKYLEDFLIYQAEYAYTHGAKADRLGAGMLYYSLAYAHEAHCCVCLGSGGGFVPRMMRQAQFDLGMAGEAATWLVDANLPAAGWGKPEFDDNPRHVFNSWFDVQRIRELTSEAVARFEDGSIDYLHIDADHSYAGVAADFQAWAPKVKPAGVITLHDTQYCPSVCGVPRLVRELQRSPEWSVVDLTLGTGVAIVNRRN